MEKLNAWSVQFCPGIRYSDHGGSYFCPWLLSGAKQDLRRDACSFFIIYILKQMYEHWPKIVDVCLKLKMFLLKLILNLNSMICLLFCKQKSCRSYFFKKNILICNHITNIHFKTMTLLDSAYPATFIYLFIIAFNYCCKMFIALYVYF